METQQNISVCLWFDGQAEDAAKFYTSVFDNAKITATSRYDKASAKASGRKEGSAMTVAFSIEGFSFLELNGGPQFSINSSISFILNFDPSKDKKASENLENCWNKLSEKGEVLMPLDEYPFSKKYGWIQDKFGVSWQLMLTNPEGENRPFITPSLMFAGENTNKAEEAVNFYTAIFSGAKIGYFARYPEKTGPAFKGALMYGDFTIKNTWLSVMDSGVEQNLTFNEGISIVVLCENQKEIDIYWEKLSTVPEAEACGWLKDKFGVSWQIIPKNMAELLSSEAATRAMMQMKKIDIQKLKNAI